MTTKRFSRHWLLWGVGAVVLGFYVVSLTQDGQATTKKTDAKKEKGKDKDTQKKEEGKVEPPPAKFPEARIVRRRQPEPPETGCLHRRAKG